MSNREAIAIVDAGLGNIASIQRMIEKVGGKAFSIIDPTQLHKGGKVILPGVGHFDEGMSRLTETGFADILVDLGKSQNIHVMGICLGMQLLCRNSEEGKLPGLGLIEANVKKFRFPAESNLKVPHMGWNVVSTVRENPLLPASAEEQRFYFVHSYKVVPDDSAITIGTANHGGEFCAAFQQGNIFGVQFHPEKSQRFGMELMRRFVEL
jgi:imidazole glycerol-phosphate synthase subunit HisH